MRHLLQEVGLDAGVAVDSAGTAAHHVGEGPDRRSVVAALRRGIKLGGQARQFEDSDWDAFDYILAMDSKNFADLSRRARTPAARARLHLFRDFDPAVPKGSSTPDPYYGGTAGFDEVVEICQVTCGHLLTHVRRVHGV